MSPKFSDFLCKSSEIEGEKNEKECGGGRATGGQGCQLSRIWRDSHAFDLLLTHSRN